MKKLLFTSAGIVFSLFLFLAPLQAHGDRTYKPGKKAGQMKGSVTQLGNGTIAINLPNGETYTFVTNPNTRIMMGKRVSVLDSVMVGSKVRINFRTVDNNRLATEIYLFPVKPEGNNGYHHPARPDTSGAHRGERPR